MTSVGSRKVLVLVLVLALAAVTTFPAYAQAITMIDRVTVPYETIVTACNGEDVYLSGELLLISQTTVDANTGVHSQFTLVPQYVRGVGSLTGTQYKAVGGDRSHFNIDADSAPATYTNTDMYLLVSQGGTENLLVKFTLHVTVNANGEGTAFVDNFSAECVG
jgi:hypothetical protein